MKGSRPVPRMGVTAAVLLLGRGLSEQSRQPFNAGPVGSGFDSEGLICHVCGACHFGRGLRRASTLHTNTV